jgi:glutathione S-transferase
MITVYGVPRSRTMRVLWMLEEVGVPYENVKVNFMGESRAPEFLKLNPNGHIPVLKDGDTVIWESLAINLYLARKYGKDLWPRTPEDEGRTYQWTLRAMTELEEPLLTTLLHRRLFPEGQRDVKKADDAAQRFEKPRGVLDGALADRPYLLGDTFTAADLNVASVMAWTALAGLDLAAAPRVQAWLARCTDRPAFARAQQKL